MSAESETAPAVDLSRFVKPRLGQVWAFGGKEGRRDTVKRVSRGAAGRWRIEGGQVTRPIGKSAAMWVQWQSGMATITVKSLWRHWVYVA